jgi:hypothetical protein
MFNNMDAYPLSIKATIDESQLRNAPCADRTQSCRRLYHRRESRRALRFHAYRNLKPSDNRSHRCAWHKLLCTLLSPGRCGSWRPCSGASTRDLSPGITELEGSCTRGRSRIRESVCRRGPWKKLICLLYATNVSSCSRVLHLSSLSAVVSYRLYQLQALDIWSSPVVGIYLEKPNSPRSPRSPPQPSAVLRFMC